MFAKIVLVCFTLSLPVLFLYFLEPHIIVEETRSSQAPISLMGSYLVDNNIDNTKARHESDSTACLALIIADNGNPDRLIQPAYPHGLALPVLEDIKKSPKVLLHGYAYEKISTNLLSNKKQRSHSPRFDVLSWQLLDSVGEKKHATYHETDHDPQIFQLRTHCDDRSAVTQK